MTNIADRQRRLGWRGALNAGPYISYTTGGWRRMTRLTYPRVGYNLEGDTNDVPRSRDSTDDNGTVYPNPSYKGKRRVLCHSTQQRHRLYRQVCPPGPLYYDLGTGVGGTSKKDLFLNSFNDLTPFFQSYPSWPFLPMSRRAHFITRDEAYRTEVVGGISANVVRDTLWECQINVDGTIEMIGEVTFAERWAWRNTEYNLFPTHNYEQLSLVYRCSRVVIYRDCTYGDDGRIVLPDPEYILRDTQRPNVPSDHYEFEPMNFYGQRLQTIHECDFTPTFPGGISAWAAQKNVNRYGDIDRVTGDSLTGALNNPSDEAGHDPTSESMWLTAVNTDNIPQEKFSTGNDIILFGTDDDTLPPRMPFDIMAKLDIYAWKLITGEFFKNGDDPVQIIKTSSDVSFAFISGEVFYCV